jgi:hypothetical protein
VGVSVSVLRALKESGIFEFNHLLPSKAGYHELDLNSFTKKLLALAPPKGKANNFMNDGIALKAVMGGHHDSPKTKVDVVRALLAGSLRIVGNADGAIAGLSIDRAEYCRIAIAARIRAAEDTMPAYKVEEHLLCDSSTVPGLFHMGLLKGRNTPTGLRITNGSVEDFKTRYVSLASIANSIGTTSSRGLMSLCERHGIEMLLVPRAGRRGEQPFVQISDCAKLLEVRKK